MSFEIKAGGEITGKTDSLKDSQDLDQEGNKLDSLDHVAGRNRQGSPSKHFNHRESFFKSVLLSQVKNQYPEDHVKLTESVADSHSEGSNSEDENEEATFEIQRKKSKFGPQS
jgi:hypothetical protein